MKLPYLFFDGLVVFSLIRLVRDSHRRRETVLYWLFNPFVLYAVYFFGQYDILPTAIVFFGFTLLYLRTSLQTWKKQIIFMLLLGFAVGLKVYPIFLFLPSVFLLTKSQKHRIILLMVAMIPIFLLTIPFLHTDLPLTRIWFPNFVFSSIQIGFIARLKQALLITVYFLAIILASHFSGRAKPRIMAGIYLLILVSIYSFTQFASLHYLVWAIPFLPLWFRRVQSAYLLCWVLFFGLLGFRIMAQQHQLGLFTPLNPSLFPFIPSIADVVGRFVSYQIISNTSYIMYHGTLLLFLLSVLIRLSATQNDRRAR